MSIKQQAMTVAMEIVQKHPLKSYDLTDLGFSRTITNSALTQLVRDKKIFRHGHARASYYTLNDQAVKKLDMQKRETGSLELPELPAIMLDWMGYTNLVPVNPIYVQGYASKGAD